LMYLLTVLASLKGVPKKGLNGLQKFYQIEIFSKFLFDKISATRKEKITSTPFVRSTKQ
jgi:hypothetical protein